MTEKQEQELALQLRENSKELISTDNSVNATILDSGKFTQLMRASAMFAKSELVPAQFRGRPQDCFIALDLACRLEINPYMVFQNMYVVHGRPGLQAQFVIALMNRHGPFEGPVEYEYKGHGKTRACTAYAVLSGSKRRCEATVDWCMVEAEGWNKKNGSKWLTMPDQMFSYRAAAFLARKYCPEVLMGMQTVEELEDIKEEKPATNTVEAIIEKIDETKPDPPRPKEKKEKPKPKKNGTKSIFVNDKTDEKTHDNKLEMIIVRAKKDGLTQEAIDRWLDEIGIDKFDKTTQTEDRLIDFAARVDQHSEM